MALVSQVVISPIATATACCSNYIYSTYGGWPSGQTIFRSKNIWGPYEEKMLVEKWIKTGEKGIAIYPHQGKVVKKKLPHWEFFLLSPSTLMGDVVSYIGTVTVDGNDDEADERDDKGDVGGRQTEDSGVTVDDGSL